MNAIAQLCYLRGWQAADPTSQKNGDGDTDGVGDAIGKEH